ncbi:type II toxin-antitoxin system VapC family toxin [Ruania alba]|uniref:Ribonuclease VapC n=1 Tax=Ruania alba TaxID=648782 RepID=A0A1H5CP12_9MICO|nr:Predicted nucleic acid-binding protein, contains PIN domain [Ruania alba]
MRVVLDASAGVDAVLANYRGSRVLDAMQGAELLAPCLIDSEVMSALARMERASSISAAEARRGLDAWLRLACERVPSEHLLHDAWSRRAALRVSDAQYVALAAGLGAPLLTCDARLARSPVAGVQIQLIA